MGVGFTDWCSRGRRVTPRESREERQDYIVALRPGTVFDGASSEHRPHPAANPKILRQAEHPGDGIFGWPQFCCSPEHVSYAAAAGLDGHAKTDHTWSLQNRLTEGIGTAAVFTPAAAVSTINGIAPQLIRAIQRLLRARAVGWTTAGVLHWASANLPN